MLHLARGLSEGRRTLPLPAPREFAWGTRGRQAADRAAQPRWLAGGRARAGSADGSPLPGRPNSPAAVFRRRRRAVRFGGLVVVVVVAPSPTQWKGRIRWRRASGS
jgi:hypothetical protein